MFSARLHQQVAEGLRSVWADRLLRVLSLFTAAITLVAAGFPLALIVAARHLGATPGLIGIILGISGVGGLPGGWGHTRENRAYYTRLERGDLAGASDSEVPRKRRRRAGNPTHSFHAGGAPPTGDMGTDPAS